MAKHPTPKFAKATFDPTQQESPLDQGPRLSGCVLWIAIICAALFAGFNWIKVFVPAQELDQLPTVALLPSETPTGTLKPTLTPTKTFTPTITLTYTPTNTATFTATNTLDPSVSPTVTNTPTATFTATKPPATPKPRTNSNSGRSSGGGSGGSGNIDESEPSVNEQPAEQPVIVVTYWLTPELAPPTLTFTPTEPFGCLAPFDATATPIFDERCNIISPTPTNTQPPTLAPYYTETPWPTSTFTEMPTITPEPPTFTPMPTETPWPTATFTETPTITPEPPTFTPMPTATQIPTNTPEILATAEVMQ